MPDYIGGMTEVGGYAYAGFSAGATVAVSDYWKLSAGVRYACNNDSDGGYAAVAGKENNIWFGVGTSIGF